MSSLNHHEGGMTQPLRPDPDEWPSLIEASKQYQISKSTLQDRLVTGEMVGMKVRGSRGYEWCVHASVLESFGGSSYLRWGEPAADEQHP